MGYRLAEKRGPRKLTNFQGSPSPGPRAVHANKGEIKQMLQEASIDEERTPDEDRVLQSSSAVESGEGFVGQEEKLLQVH